MPISPRARSPRPGAPRKRTTAPKRKVLFVASECAPYAKVGGLADVVAALPKTLRRMGHDARIVLPLYASMDRTQYGIRFLRSACVHMGKGEEQWIGVHGASLDGGVPVWFVEYDRFFGRPGLYDDAGGEYGDNAFRFALLSKAALQICKDSGFIPDVMHAHDWPTALVPVFLKTWDRVLSPLSATASVLTIHNIGYQGVYHASAFPYIGVGGEHFAPDRFEDHGKINLLKAGIFFADALTTVSPGHAREIVEPVGGMGLAPRLDARRADLTGILNGADYDHWNPETDPLIPARYSARDLSGKGACKAALQRRMGLAERPDWPLFGIVSRFAPQKGFGLLVECLQAALGQMAFQLAVLGTGDPWMENYFGGLAAAWPGRVACHVGFSNELSHWIEAGSDFFLMPSLYEPCGLNQMYSMKYATLPVVRATGGLDDTVENYDEATDGGTGFKFWQPTASALQNTIGWAVSTWFDRPRHIARLRRNAMREDFSWEHAVAEYVNVYERAIAARRLSA
ncbi:MAG: glycogen synthase GlgA [Verrucomicrobia bacterium]|nr:glycogen synthase GlgA [Verrucomicrobiota bacterium]